MSLLQNDERPSAIDTALISHASLQCSETLSIGQLARVTGETVKTLRYWTDRGLIEAGRGENNYRTYNQSASDRAAFIRNAQGLGLKLEAVGRLLNLADESQLPCDRVKQELDIHLAGVRRQLAALRGLEVTLAQMLASAEEQPCEAREGCRYLPLPRA